MGACCIKREDEQSITALPLVDDWSLEQAFWLCSKGQESIFENKVNVLDGAASLSEASDRLNSGKATCEDGYCIVKCSGGKVYYCLYRRGKKKAAYQALGVDEGDFSLSAADNTKMRMVERAVRETAEKMADVKAELRRTAEEKKKYEEENIELKLRLEEASTASAGLVMVGSQSEEVAQNGGTMENKASESPKRKGAAALLKGLRSGEVSKIVDTMEDEAPGNADSPSKDLSSTSNGSPSKSEKDEKMARKLSDRRKQVDSGRRSSGDGLS